MKQIALLTVIATDTSAQLDYADAIRTVIRHPLDQQRGVNIDEMRRGIRILDKLDASEGILELEDADWEHLKLKVEAMAWGMVDRHILEFIDAILTPSPNPVVNGKVMEIPARA